MEVSWYFGTRYFERASAVFQIETKQKQNVLQKLWKYQKNSLELKLWIDPDHEFSDMKQRK